MFSFIVRMSSQRQYTVMMQVPWWTKRQMQYRKEGSTDKSGLPTDGSSPGYWCASHILTAVLPQSALQAGSPLC